MNRSLCDRFSLDPEVFGATKVDWNKTRSGFSASEFATSGFWAERDTGHSCKSTTRAFTLVERVTYDVRTGTLSRRSACHLGSKLSTLSLCTPAPYSDLGESQHETVETSYTDAILCRKGTSCRPLFTDRLGLFNPTIQRERAAGASSAVTICHRPVELELV